MEVIFLEGAADRIVTDDAKKFSDTLKKNNILIPPDPIRLEDIEVTRPEDDLLNRSFRQAHNAQAELLLVF